MREVLFTHCLILCDGTRCQKRVIIRWPKPQSEDHVFIGWITANVELDKVIAFSIPLIGVTLSLSLFLLLGYSFFARLNLFCKLQRRWDVVRVDMVWQVHASSVTVENNFGSLDLSKGKIFLHLFVNHSVFL